MTILPLIASPHFHSRRMLTRDRSETCSERRGLCKAPRDRVVRRGRPPEPCRRAAIATPQSPLRSSSSNQSADGKPSLSSAVIIQHHRLSLSDSKQAAPWRRGCHGIVGRQCAAGFHHLASLERHRSVTSPRSLAWRRRSMGSVARRTAEVRSDPSHCIHEVGRPESVGSRQFCHWAPAQECWTAPSCSSVEAISCRVVEVRSRRRVVGR